MLLDTRAAMLAEVERLRAENAMLAERNALWRENRELKALRRAEKLARRGGPSARPILVATAQLVPVTIAAPVAPAPPSHPEAPRAPKRRASKRKAPDLGGVEITLYTEANMPHAPVGGFNDAWSGGYDSEFKAWRKGWADHAADPKRPAPYLGTCAACSGVRELKHDRKRQAALQRIRRFQATGSVAGILPVSGFKPRARMTDAEAARVVLPNLCARSPLEQPPAPLERPVQNYLVSRGCRVVETENGAKSWSCGCKTEKESTSAWGVIPCDRHRWAIHGRPDEGVVIYGRKAA